MMMSLYNGYHSFKCNHYWLLVQKLLLCAFIIIHTCILQTGGAQVEVINSNNSPIKCKDDSGNDVDWFIAYKLPKIHDSPNPHIRQGLGYAYILPGQDDWVVSSGKGIDSPDSLVGFTLGPLFHEDINTTTNLAYILYNDQPPQGPTMVSNGHTKGVIITTSQGGIWLQHSVPHFPSLYSDQQGLTRNYSYPKTGENNGQVAQCLSLELDQVDNIGNILIITKPHVYNFSIPDELSKSLPILQKVVRKMNDDHPGETSRLGYQYQFIDHYNVAHENDSHYKYETQWKWNESEVNYKVVQIKNAGRVLYAFAKGPSFHEEIYSTWIAPKMQSELDVQSWLNGPNPYPSNCTSGTNKVYNIDDKVVGASKFSTHNDHSKWAIATQRPVVCIGDLNRMEHQTKRGGTVNCFNEKSVWKAFKKTVVSTQPCSRPITSVG